MRTLVIYATATGRIERLTARRLGDPYLGPGQAVLDASPLPLSDVLWSYHVADGLLQPRPVTGLPATHALALDTDWTVPDVPDGTEVTIDDIPVGTVSGGLVLNFAEPGAWRVGLVPPFPHMPAACVVTVT